MLNLTHEVKIGFAIKCNKFRYFFWYHGGMIEKEKQPSFPSDIPVYMS